MSGRSARGVVVALVGAESTGKTTLAEGLRRALDTGERRVAVVGEYLREFCDRAGRTPHQGEQRGIAEEQSRRIEAAAVDHDLVIADTTALMTAVYSDWVFGDRSLYPDAEALHARCDLTLLTAPDIAWQADGLQRDSAEVREPIDALVRAALARAGSPYAVVRGDGPDRLQAALASVERSLQPPTPTPPARWHWHCERCGDPGCERRVLRLSTEQSDRLTAASSFPPAGSNPA